MDDGLKGLPRTMVRVGANTITGGAASLPPLGLTSVAAATVPLTVKGAASQSADLQQWQNSAGGVLASVNASGDITGHILITASAVQAPQITTNSGAGPLFQFTTTAIKAIPHLTTDIPFVCQGLASQSADLQQWQNSTGTVLAKVDAFGNATFAGITTTASQANISSGGTIGLYVNATAATTIPLLIRAAASQTADVVQFQNSAATTLSNIDKIGRFGSANVEAVTAVAGANAGTTPPAPVVTGSTDVRGLITWGTGTTPAAGAQVAVTFPTAWANAPYVVITPLNSATAALLPYVAAATTTGFTISLQAAPAASQGNTVYGCQFLVIG